MKPEKTEKDAPRHLTSFFSTGMLRTYFTIIWLCGLAILISWPKRPLFDYLETGVPPACLSGVLIAAALVLSYINLRCGRGELAARPTMENLKKSQPYLEESKSFFTYTLIAFILHTVFLMALPVPFFLIALSVSGGTFRILLNATLTIFLTALLLRCFGFFAYLTLKRWNNFSYLFTRVIFFAFFFLTTKFCPSINPLQTVYGLSVEHKTGIPLHAGPYLAYFTLVAASLLLLILANQLIVTTRKAAA